MERLGYACAVPLNLANAAIVLAVRPGKVVLCRRKPGRRFAGLYSPPSGSVEPGETPQAAGVREVLEESGLVVAESRLEPLGHMETVWPYDGMPCGGMFYLLRLEAGEVLEQREPHKHEAWEEFSFQEAAALPLPPLTQPLLQCLAVGAAEG